MRNEVPKEKNTRRSGVCYLDATMRHVTSAAAVEEHLTTKLGSEKAAFQIRMDPNSTGLEDPVPGWQK